MRILIAEDDRVALRVIREQLSGLGHEVIVCENGVDAIREVNRTSPDLFLCDIMMPGLSGLTTVNLLRNTFSFRKPVIMMSSVLSYMRSLDAGANAFLLKPFSTEQLSEKIQLVQ